MFAHHYVRDFLGTGPVQIQFFQGPLRPDVKRFQNTVHLIHDTGGLFDYAVRAANAAVSHSCGNIVGAERFTDCQA